jgi:hypothetical protein
MRARFSLSAAIVLLLLVIPSSAQQAASAASLPAVTFKLEWAQGRPWTSYTITVAENGAANFSGTSNSAENTGDDKFERDFTMTEANRQKVFDWAQATNYFGGQFEIKQKNIAKTGTKTLEYHSASNNNSTTYNYSPNPNVQQLTKLFQSIATTLDYGRKLDFQYRFDKLGMDTRLKELTDLQASGMVEELQAIEPILRKIADDPNLMHIARLEAKQLLKSAGLGATAANPASSQP